jgi:hypothetical protein
MKYRQCRRTDLNCCEETCEMCNAMQANARWLMGMMIVRKPVDDEV